MMDPEPTKSPRSKKTIRDLYPNLTPEQAEEAEENIRRYLSVIIRIYERLHLRQEVHHKQAFDERDPIS
jgi:hypothetical protein